MAGRTSKPDIKRPGASLGTSALRTAALWVVGGSTVFGGIVGGALWYKHVHEPAVEHAHMVVRSHMPKGFLGVLAANTSASSNKPPPVPASGVEAPTVQTPAPAPKPKVKHVAKRRRRVVVVRRRAPAPKAAALFKPLPGPNPAVVAFNEEREGAAQIQVGRYGSVGPGGVRSVKWVNSQKKFKEPRNVASYPLRDPDRIITADENIPAVLENAINTQLSGKVVAQISENVYGAAGRLILIPAGSHAVGHYFPLNKVGDTRVQIIWTRIITPQHINIRLANAQMADAMGRSGITGDVDEHYWQKYGIALMVSTLSALAEYPIPVKNAGQAVVIQSYGQGAESMAQSILNQNLNIRPTVSIPAGARILISPQRDIWFPEPKKATVDLAAANEREFGK